MRKSHQIKQFDAPVVCFCDNEKLAHVYVKTLVRSLEKSRNKDKYDFFLFLDLLFTPGILNDNHQFLTLQVYQLQCPGTISLILADRFKTIKEICNNLNEFYEFYTQEQPKLVSGFNQVRFLDCFQNNPGDLQLHLTSMLMKEKMNQNDVLEYYLYYGRFLSQILDYSKKAPFLRKVFRPNAIFRNKKQKIRCCIAYLMLCSVVCPLLQISSVIRD